MVKPGPGVVEIADDCLIQDIALGQLQTHCAHQNQAMQCGRRHRRHLSRNPPAKAEPDQQGPFNAKIGRRPLIDHGDVADTAQPLRSFGFAVTRMVRNDHVEATRQRVVKLELIGIADIVMQYHNRAAAAGAREVQLASGHLDLAAGPVRAHRHRHSSPDTPYGSVAPRQPNPQPSV